jgi:hypothetical protein
VLGFLMSVFMLIVGLFFLVGVPAISAFLGGAEAEIAAMGASFGIFIGLIYVIVGGILFMPPLYLYRYAKSISKAERSGEYTDIIEALRFQKSFWKFAGVIVLIYLIFMAYSSFLGLSLLFCKTEFRYSLFELKGKLYIQFFHNKNIRFPFD